MVEPLELGSKKISIGKTNIAKTTSEKIGPKARWTDQRNLDKYDENNNSMVEIKVI